MKKASAASPTVSKKTWNQVRAISCHWWPQKLSDLISFWCCPPPFFEGVWSLVIYCSK
jgi:hypothetical protein